MLTNSAFASVNVTGAWITAIHGVSRNTKPSGTKITFGAIIVVATGIGISRICAFSTAGTRIVRAGVTVVAIRCGPAVIIAIIGIAIVVPVIAFFRGTFGEDGGLVVAMIGIGCRIGIQITASGRHGGITSLGRSNDDTTLPDPVAAVIATPRGITVI